MGEVKNHYQDAIHDAGVIESYYKFRKQVREDKTDGYIKESTIKDMFIKHGFKVVFVCQNINGRYKHGYYKTKVTHSFKSFADKLKASNKIREKLNQIRII